MGTKENKSQKIRGVPKLKKSILLVGYLTLVI